MSDAGNSLSKDETRELQKLKIRQEMQEEITSWAKKRFAVLGIVAGVLGFFGISTVLHESLQILLTKPVNEAIEKFEEAKGKLDQAREQAREKIIELSLLSKNVEDQGRNAQQAAADAEIKIRELSANIDDGRKEAVEIQEKYNNIRDSMSRVSNDVFELASGISEEERRLKAEIGRASESLTALEKLSVAIARSFGDSRVNMALDTFQLESDAINGKYIEEFKRIDKVRNFNVVYYIDGAEGDETAQAVVRALKSEGYRAAVWYAQGSDRSDIINEISGEFGDISDVLKENLSGMVIDPKHDDIAGEIERLLSSEFHIKGLSSVRRPLQPAQMHLSYDQGRKSFETDKIILIYSFADGGT